MILSFSVVTKASLPSCLFDLLSLESISGLVAPFSVLTASFSALTLSLFVVLSESCSMWMDAGSVCMSSPVFSVLMERYSIGLAPFDGMSFVMFPDSIVVLFTDSQYSLRFLCFL